MSIDYNNSNLFYCKDIDLFLIWILSIWPSSQRSFHQQIFRQICHHDTKQLPSWSIRSNSLSIYVSHLSGTDPFMLSQSRSQTDLTIVPSINKIPYTPAIWSWSDIGNASISVWIGRLPWHMFANGQHRGRYLPFPWRCELIYTSASRRRSIQWARFPPIHPISRRATGYDIICAARWQILRIYFVKGLFRSKLKNSVV